MQQSAGGGGSIPPRSMGYSCQFGTQFQPNTQLSIIFGKLHFLKSQVKDDSELEVHRKMIALTPRQYKRNPLRLYLYPIPLRIRKTVGPRRHAAQIIAPAAKRSGFKSALLLFSCANASSLLSDAFLLCSCMSTETAIVP